jgi:hypothetical protein
MPAVKPIPASYPRVAPHVSVAGAADAIDFYKSVFGATERMRMGMPDGTVAHAELELDGSVIMIGEEMPGGTDPGPKTLGGSPVVVFVYVETSMTSSSGPPRQAPRPSRNRRTTSAASLRSRLGRLRPAGRHARRSSTSGICRRSSRRAFVARSGGACPLGRYSGVVGPTGRRLRAPSEALRAGPPATAPVRIADRAGLSISAASSRAAVSAGLSPSRAR